MMKDLPVGQANFEDLRKDNGVYVDKTPFIHQIISGAKRFYFLSRPRRFGKSLLLSTIKALFEGKRELFAGLYIEDKFAWDPHPVVMLDMTKNAEDTTSLKRALASHVKNQAELAEVELDDADDPSVLLEQLIVRAYVKTGKQVVVLIDEYDKPILDRMEDLEQANNIREALYPFYGVLKAASPYLKLLFVTGITKISQTTIFSGFNNLDDITFDAAYAGICGYTQQELEVNFREHLLATCGELEMDGDELLAEIKRWYDGYTWDGDTFVYNPFSVLLLFDKHRFKPFWYNTGTPSYLLKLLKMDGNLELLVQGEVDVPETFTDGQALENLDPIALLYQAGYLTIRSFDPASGSYLLQLPNYEVRKAVSELVLADASNTTKTKRHVLSKEIEKAFRTGNTELAVTCLEALLANTTYNTHAPNGNESHYQALFQLAMTLSGIDHRGESQNWKGRADAVLPFEQRVYVVEIKYAPDAEGLPAALATGMRQIHEKQYHTPYLNQGKAVHLLALAFTRGKVAFAEEVK